MKTQKSIFRSATCFPNKVIYALILIKLFVIGALSTEIYANGLTVFPATIFETYDLYTTNEKLLTLTNTADTSIDYTVEFKASKNGSSDWLTISQESGTLGAGSSADLALTIEVSEEFPFDRQSAEVYVKWNIDGGSSRIVVPVKVVASATLWDLDNDRYPDIFEDQFGSATQDPDSFPKYSESQTGENKYYIVDDDFAAEEMSVYKTQTIQEAIDAASSTVDEYAEAPIYPYAIIQVYPGLYKEEITIPPGTHIFLFASNESALAQGGEAPYAIIDENDSYGPVVSIHASNTAIDGFEVTGGYQTGIHIGSSDVLIKSCDIHGNSTSSYSYYAGGGIHINRDHVLIEDCRVHDNIDIFSNGGGIYTSGSDILIKDCEIYDNATDHNGGGMFNRGGENIKIQNTKIYRNIAALSGGGIFTTAGKGFEVIHSTLFNNNANLGSEIGRSNSSWDQVEKIKFINSIVWNYDNDEANIFDLETDISASNSVILGSVGYVNEGGVSNEDPRLTAQGLLTNHEVPTSSAIDQAIASALAIDIQSETRPFNNVSDIGADEFTDSDADGLPDFWVEQYFGDSPVDPINYDADDDSLTTLDEYVWGMNPSIKLFQGISFNDELLSDGDSVVAVGELRVSLDNEPIVSMVEFIVEDSLDQRILSYTDAKAPFMLSVDTTNISDSGNYTFRILVFNHRGEFVEETRTVQVGANRAPTIEPIDDDALIEGDLFTYQVNATDSDSDDALLSYSISASPEVDSMELEISTDGLISFNTSVQQDELAGRDFTITVTVTDVHPEETRFAKESFNLRVREIITFENQAIEDEIRALLNMPEPAQIIETDLLLLTGALDLSELGLVDIQDLVVFKYAINITDLNLSGNAISDLTPLSGLTQLVTLNLSNNQTSDINALTELNNLTTLNLSSNLLDLDAGDEDVSIINELVDRNTAVDSSNQARFTLSISVLGGGTVSLDPIQDDYGYGDQLTLTATPTGENLFVGWSGAVAETESTITYEMTANATSGAEFADGIVAGNGDGLIVDTYGYLNDPIPEFVDSFNGPGYRSLLDGPIFMNASPAKDINGRSTYFSGRLFGNLEARYTGSHRFYIPGQSYVDTMVYLNGEEILHYDNWTASNRKYISDPIDLIAGETYTIEIFYRASSLNIWGRTFYVDWELPDGSTKRIAQSQLYSGYEFMSETPDFASAVVAEYSDSDGNIIDISGTSLEFGLGTLPLNSKVELSAGAGETIRYTLDGSEPNAASRIYTEGITISGNTTLKARAYSATAPEGAVFTGVYTIDDANPVLSDLQLPDVDAPEGFSTTTIRVGDNTERVISINVEDDSSVTDVRFYLTDPDTENTVFLGADETGNPEVSGARYEVPFNIFNFEDGDWDLDIIATDFFGNEATFEQGIQIVISPPEAPVINQPSDGLGFADGQITISGTARMDCMVEVQARLIDSDGSPLPGLAGTFTAISGPVSVSSSGGFSLIHTFADNQGDEQYELRAVAIGRNNVVSPFTPTVKISVDSSIPPSPVNLTVVAETGGDIRISWGAPLIYSGIIKAYRIQVSEDGGMTWTLVDEVSGNIDTYLYERSDQIGSPPYVFRVLAVNAANTETLASEAQVTTSIVPDATAPQITQLEWIPQDDRQFDAVDSKYGPGLLTVRINVSEAVSETPYVALVPPGLGLPYRVDLIAITDQRFEGVVAIEDGMTSGDYQVFAVLSDFAGNQSRSDDPSNLPFVDILYAPLTIDTETPQVANLDPASQSVFKNGAAGTTLSYTFTFDEMLLEGSVPVAIAEWGSSTSVDSSDITLQELGAGSYQVDVALSPVDGYDGSDPDPNPEVEEELVNQSMLTVLIEVQDTVGNSGYAEIPAVLIYRNSLPQSAPPVLNASVLQGGNILLEWEDVPNADRYQLMRVDSPEDEILATVLRYSEEFTTYEYTYTAPSDSDYSFYVFGEREDLLNPGTYITGYSLSPVLVTADSTAPAPAHTVEIEDANPNNPNAVLRIEWQHPDSGEVDHFDVYRTAIEPSGASAVDPSWALIRENINSLQEYTFDSQPFAGQAWYIVVSSDALGNESLALNFPTSDITIVPPAEVKVSIAEGSFPVLSWTAVDAITTSTEGSYSVYHGDSGPDVELASGLTDLEFTDTTWDGESRTYWIESRNGEFQARRNLTLHDYTFDLSAENILYCGLPSPIKLDKIPSITGWNFRIHINKKANDEDPLPAIYSGELNKSFVNFGLNTDSDDVAGSQDVVVQIEMLPNSYQNFGESVWFEIKRSLPVVDRLPVLSLESDIVSRGSTASDIELSISNPSESDFKVQFSEGHSVLKLYDTSGNLLSQTDLTEEADRTLLGENSLIISFLEIEIPEEAPDTVILQAELSQYSNPQTGQLFTPEEPITTRLTLSTVELSYTAEIISPKIAGAASLLTGETLEIKGRAVDKNGAPRAAALVTFGLENGEFKRTFSLVTDSHGEFSYTFDPDGTEPGGVYTVWAKHPELVRTPDASEAVGAFTYKRITVSPEYHTVRIPRNYTQGVPITITWPEYTTLSDFTVETATFGGEDLPTGLSVTIPEISDPAAGATSLEIIPQILPLFETGAPNEANLLFRVSAKIEGAVEATVLGEVPAYCYFSQTFGQLTGPSKLISLSVLREMDGGVTTAVQDDSASFDFTNTGMIPLTGLQFDVMQRVVRDGSTVGYEPAPKWLKLTGALPEALAVGEAVELQLNTDLESQPEASLPANGSYGNYVILAKSNEAPSRTAAIELNVTSDSDSGLEVHVINAYFGFDASTLPDGGSGFSIPSDTLETYQSGVPGAKITLQQDDLQSVIGNNGWAMPLIYKGTTDEDGKVNEWTNLVTGETLPSIPSGRYQMSVEASKHDTYKGVLVIKPGVTGFEQIPLSYGAVTVEWEVREITLQDRYEVTIETVFETEVPAPVVTTTPAHITLPDMCPGDVFEVELIIENHGIISALDMENPIPESDAYLRIEPLVDLGETFDLPPRQSRRIAYRCICIKALPDSECN